MEVLTKEPKEVRFFSSVIACSPSSKEKITSFARLLVLMNWRFFDHFAAGKLVHSKIGIIGHLGTKRSKVLTGPV